MIMALYPNSNSNIRGNLTVQTEVKPIFAGNSLNAESKLL